MSLKTDITTISQGNFLQGFIRFITQTNVLETAVAIVIGNAFKGIIDDFVTSVLSPIVSSVIPSGRLEDLEVKLPKSSPQQPATNIRYGVFIKSLLGFLLQTLVIYLIVRAWIRVKNISQDLLY